MSDIFDKFDREIDTAGLAADCAEVAKNGGSDFPEIPDGTYEVQLTQMELGESKKGLPMVKARFKIMTGRYAKSLIFYNQVIHTGFGLHKNNEFLHSMGFSDVKFQTFRQYGNLMLDIAEECERLTFALKYGHDAKGFSTFDITEVFDD